MIKKTITYNDYNGEERTEDFYFNLTKAELIELEVVTEGGLAETIQRISKAKDTPAIITLFKDIIMKSYGKKSPDGKRFIKSKDVLDEFVQSEAFSELFMELASDSTAASAFINGILPVTVKKDPLQMEIVD